jgi:hypothetical protein
VDIRHVRGWNPWMDTGWSGIVGFVRWLHRITDFNLLLGGRAMFVDTGRVVSESDESREVVEALER